MDHPYGASYVQKCAVEGQSWQQLQRAYLGICGCSPGIRAESFTVYHCHGGSIAKFRTGCPWELLYADELVIVAESLEELARLKLWKNGLEQKGLKVDVDKTKIMLSAYDASKAKIKSIKFPCAVCGKDIGTNSIQCTSCNKWLH